LSAFRYRLTQSQTIRATNSITKEGSTGVQFVCGLDAETLPLAQAALQQAKELNLRTALQADSIRLPHISHPITKYLDEAHIGMETFDQSAYAHFHVAGPKSSFAAQAAAAQMFAKLHIPVRIGILIGLADPADDLRAAVDFCRSLNANGAIRLLVRRFRPTPGAVIKDPPVSVSAKQLGTLIKALRSEEHTLDLMMTSRDLEWMGMACVVDHVILSGRGGKPLHVES
jgi:pyruvate-formate lyase-activating enzyme